VRGAVDAERDGDGVDQEEADRVEQQRHRQPAADDRQHRLAVLERLAEVAAQQARGQPVGPGLVRRQLVAGRVEEAHRLLGLDQAARPCPGIDAGLDHAIRVEVARLAWRRQHQRRHDQRDPEQGRDHEQQPPEEVPAHAAHRRRREPSSS
jgi:hypothetical protein